MDLKNHIIINLSDKQKGMLLVNHCTSWYTFSEPVDNIDGGVLIKESLSTSSLIRELNIPLSNSGETFKQIFNHNSHIPIFKLHNH